MTIHQFKSISFDVCNTHRMLYYSFPRLVHFMCSLRSLQFMFIFSVFPHGNRFYSSSLILIHTNPTHIHPYTPQLKRITHVHMSRTGVCCWCMSVFGYSNIVVLSLSNFNAMHCHWIRIAHGSRILRQCVLGIIVVGVTDSGLFCYPLLLLLLLVSFVPSIRTK